LCNSILYARLDCQIQAYNDCIKKNLEQYSVIKKCKYLLDKSSSLVAKAPNSNTDITYKQEVVRVAARVPTGIDRCVSFSDADRFEPAIIPVTAGKNRPTKSLKKWMYVLSEYMKKQSIH